MSINLVIDLIGWIGAAALIIAYALVSSKRLSGQAIPFQVLNLFGGSLLIVNTLYYRAYPSSFLNLVWAGIALATIVRARKPD